MKDNFDLIVEHTNRRLGHVKRDVDKRCDELLARINRALDDEIIRLRVRPTDWRGQLEVVVIRSPYEFL